MKLYQFEGVDDLLENPDGVVPIRRAIIKPLITCQECGKWRTFDCIRAIMCIGINDFETGLRDPDPDDFCKDGTPKESK